jgi:uncharacterized protein (DUF983 family)
MFAKGSKLYSMLTGACPKCHKDNMYINKNPYIITQLMKMHDHCRKCGFKYMIEPNFFFGAMFISYALAVITGIGTFLIAHFFFGAGLSAAFISICVALIILMPVIIRLSRNIYINLFVNYDKNAGKSK